MKKYNVIIAGTIVGSYETKEEAENRLNEIRHSYLAMVHPKNCMYIKKVENNAWHDSSVML